MFRVPKCWRPSIYNAHGRQAQWLLSIETSHDSWCGCNSFVCHLLDSIFPLDNNNRSKTVHEIIESYQNQPVITVPCLTGGEENIHGGEQQLIAANEDADGGRDFPEGAPSEGELEQLFADAQRDESTG